MVKLVKQHKITPITWACAVFPLENYRLDLAGTNIYKCDRQFVKAKKLSYVFKKHHIR